jgi:large subunit ribosomal protein L6
MSRIGKKPIAVPKGVKIAVNNDVVNVEGPKGKLSLKHHANVSVAVAGDVVTVTRKDDEKLSRAVHGLTRALISNMLTGVSTGYAKDLEIQGVGYKAEQAGNVLTLSLGFANQIKIEIPVGLVLKIEAQGTKINISGADKQMVGDLAAQIRRIRKPEPYKGKGVRYVGETVKRKAGKQFAGAGAK